MDMKDAWITNADKCIIIIPQIFSLQNHKHHQERRKMSMLEDALIVSVE